MFRNARFRDDYKDIAVDITDKNYSGSNSELSKLIGIEEQIINTYDNWYFLNDEFYYFKENYIFEELFMSEIARECEVKCVNFQLAFENYCGITFNGIISKLYRAKDKEYYFYSEFCSKYFSRMENNLDFLKLSSVITFGENKTNMLMDDIFSLISFDIFTGQYDRNNEYNFFFECDDNMISLAPLCDNGLVFDKLFRYFSPFGEFSLDDDDKTYQNNLIHLLECEKVFFDKLSFCLDINIGEVLERTIQKYRIIMDSNDTDRLFSYFDNRKRVLDKTLNLVKKR